MSEPTIQPTMRLTQDQWATVEAIRQREADLERDYAGDVPCALCASGTPHHTVGLSGISDGSRRTIWDIHEVSDSGGVGLAECTAPKAAAEKAERARLHEFHRKILEDLDRTRAYHLARFYETA